MRPVGRRRFLALGGLGVASAVTGATGLFVQRSTLDVVTGQDLREPPVLSSTGGTLDARLVAAETEHEVGGVAARTMSYNGGLPGPTLRARPGETIRLQLVNRLDQPTNLHVHGLHVSPEGRSDNVFLTVGPGEEQRYEYRIPSDHPTGLFWYHPHRHGSVAEQVFSGLYGAILIEGSDDGVPVARTRLIVVSDITLGGDGTVRSGSMEEHMTGREGDQVLLNGQVMPRLQLTTGETERWQIVNACSSRYLSLRLPGHSLQLLGRDGHRLPQSRDVRSVDLVPGNRSDLLVTPGSGSSRLVSAAVNRSAGMGGMFGGSVSPEVELAIVETSGSNPQGRDGRGLLSASTLLAPALRDLRDEQVARRRTLTLTTGGGMMGMGDGMNFGFDGRAYDANRVDQRVDAGAVEEWTIRNASTMDHPFHIHVWPMQLIEEDGAPRNEVGRLDVVNVPADGEVKVLIAFDDYTGSSVYHCHILDHEDRGMMGVVEVR